MYAYVYSCYCYCYCYCYYCYCNYCYYCYCNYCYYCVSIVIIIQIILRIVLCMYVSMYVRVCRCQSSTQCTEDSAPRERALCFQASERELNVFIRCHHHAILQ